MNIAIDVDGVILDFYRTLFPDVTQSSVKDWNCTRVKEKWPEIKDDFNFWSNLPNIMDYDKIDFEFSLYLTSINKKFVDHRRENLIRNGWPDLKVVPEYDKVKWMKKNSLDLLIDDKPQTIIECVEHGINCVQFYPYFAGWEIIPNVPIARNESELNEVIKKFLNDR